MTIDQLMRSHREIALAMGWRPNRRGPDVYGYRRFAADMNQLHPHIVRSEDQMKHAMRGTIEIPPYWEKVVVELLALAAAGMTDPPAAGPFWHPNPMPRAEREKASLALRAWLARIPGRELAELSQVPRHRLYAIARGDSPLLPTELDRILVGLDLSDRDAFYSIL